MNHPFFEDINWDDVENRLLVPPFIPKVKGVNDLTHLSGSLLDPNELAISSESELSYSEKRKRHLSEFSYMGEDINQGNQINPFSNNDTYANKKFLDTS